MTKVVAVVSCLLACDSNAKKPDGDATCATVQTGLGPVEATVDGNACSYAGVPYAEPPVGPLRWKPPQPPAAWTAPRPSQPPPACAQLPFPYFGVTSDSEDCLYVNVTVPSPAPSKKMPVMVFIHGGAFGVGASTIPTYDGANLASETGVVVVTINYRLGALGFLSTPALRAEDPAHPSAGNYGVEDQVAALQWVKSNIASFGGDPTNVTIFGESAGATSMFLHLVSPKSQGLFTKVIAESTWAPYFAMALPQDKADAQGALFANALGCTDAQTEVACLRSKTPTELLNAVPWNFAGIRGSQGADWLPVVDGFVLPDDPLKLMAAGSFAKVPTLLGNVANEGLIFFVASPNPPTDDASYLALEEAQYPGHSAEVVAQYPASAFNGSYTTAAGEAFGDGSLVCPTRRLARALVAAGVPTYRYDFTHAVQFLVQDVGAFHSSELMFVFGTSVGGVPLRDNELPLSKTMMDYWGAMATSGDPNGSGRVAWPRYDATNETQMVLDLAQSTESSFKKAQCDFWDSL